MADQFGDFSDSIASAAEPLRQLLPKSVEWQWTAQHDEAFTAVKRVLASPPVLGHFYPTRPTMLETDAAREKGLGFVLRQRDEHGRWQLIQCGSRLISDTESRYAVCEREMLAVVWACQKCHQYLAGLPTFSMVTDHKPLVPILSEKALGDISNPRLQRMRQRLLHLTFVASWRPGAKHNIADALSRAPSQPAGADVALTTVLPAFSYRR